MTMKTCTTCRELKPAEAYGADKRTPDGRQRYCNPCRAAYMRQWKAKQVPGPNTVHGTYSAYSNHNCRCSECREATRLYQEDRRNADREAYRARNRKWKRENSEKVRASKAAYYKANREKALAYARARREANSHRVGNLLQGSSQGSALPE